MIRLAAHRGVVLPLLGAQPTWPDLVLALSRSKMTHSGHPRRDHEAKSPGHCQGFDLIVATSEPGPNQILKLPDEHSSDSLRSGRFVMMIDRILNRQELTNQRNYRADFSAPQQAFVRSKNGIESRS